MECQGECPLYLELEEIGLSEGTPLSERRKYSDFGIGHKVEVAIARLLISLRFYFLIYKTEVIVRSPQSKCKN